jgi:hypothetical protein
MNISMAAIATGMDQIVSEQVNSETKTEISPE